MTGVQTCALPISHPLAVAWCGHGTSEQAVWRKLVSDARQLDYVDVTRTMQHLFSIDLAWQL